MVGGDRQDPTPTTHTRTRTKRRRSGQPTQEEDPSIQEVDPEETRTQHTTWLEERVTALEREKEAMEMALQGMEAKIALQENIINSVVQRCGLLEGAITQIAEHVQGQATFNESAKRSVNCLEEQVETHQNNFKEVARILQVHEQHIVNAGAVTQWLTRNVIGLAQDNEKKRLWIGTMISEFQAQSQVLRQHEMGQQVLD